MVGGTSQVRARAWDTAFFEVPIGWVDLGGATPDAVAEAEDEARRAGIVCLYGELDPTEPATIDLVQRLGYRTMEVAMDLDHPTNVLVDPPPCSATVRQGTVEDLPALGEQIRAVAPWSRFAVDRRFGLSAAVALHHAWVERAARGEDGRMLLVAETDEGIVAMATLQEGATTPDARRPRIDLIATTGRGSGAAQALVGHAFARFGPGPSDGGPIAARNLVSLRFSEQMGYRVSGVRYLFHRWLDETDPSLPAGTTPSESGR